MSAGATGVKTGVPEYEITLILAKKLKSLLEGAGAVVIMTRTQNDVHLSNAERALLMNDSEVDCWVRIHCDYSMDSTVSGVHILAPSAKNAPVIAENSALLAELALKSISDATGAKALSVVYRTDQTGFNWSESPVVTAELGYLSNPTEDVRLNRGYYQQACAVGLYNGLVAYFEDL
jgi:N-acetylmuramoyl-L-alanine amidase